ncbi:MAG: hypothetical protein IPL96_12000 [Holophagaceae bacterium]|nr:hypothetical protein [Holophagaceae bacterium]
MRTAMTAPLILFDTCASAAEPGPKNPAIDRAGFLARATGAARHRAARCRRPEAEFLRLSRESVVKVSAFLPQVDGGC